MLTEWTDTDTEAAWRQGCCMWEPTGMLVHLIGRPFLLSGIQRLGVKLRSFCAAQSVLCPGIGKQADMIRNRAQIKRVLCVAEKNDAAKGISAIMSNNTSRRVSHVLWQTEWTPATSRVIKQFSTETKTSSFTSKCLFQFLRCCRFILVTAFYYLFLRMGSRLLDLGSVQGEHLTFCGYLVSGSGINLSPQVGESFQ